MPRWEHGGRLCQRLQDRSKHPAGNGMMSRRIWARGTPPPQGCIVARVQSTGKHGGRACIMHGVLPMGRQHAGGLTGRHECPEASTPTGSHGRRQPVHTCERVRKGVEADEFRYCFGPAGIQGTCSSGGAGQHQELQPHVCLHPQNSDRTACIASTTLQGAKHKVADARARAVQSLSQSAVWQMHWMRTFRVSGLDMELVGAPAVPESWLLSMLQCVSPVQPPHDAGMLHAVMSERLAWPAKVLWCSGRRPGCPVSH